MNGSLLRWAQRIKTLLSSIPVPGFSGIHVYDLLQMYAKGIAQGALTFRAAAISYSFFMALFPFALFILNLIPYIPLHNFQADFMAFIQDSVPPNTFGAIESILTDILQHSYKGLLSSGFVLSLFFSANGINAILGGFENSYHIQIKRKFLRQYLVALALSLGLSFLLLVTVAGIIISEIALQQTPLQEVFSDDGNTIALLRLLFLTGMILMGTALLFKFGTRQTRKSPLFSFPALFTTLLILLTSYAFGFWVLHFSKYNQLYGSIGTLLVVMFYVWINCLILLLGFELNALWVHLRHKHAVTR